MRSSVAVTAFFVLVLLFLSFFSNSCSSAYGVPDPFGYTQKDIDVKIHGTIDGQRTEALLSSRPYASAEECSICLRYILPETLSGLTVSLYGDGRCEGRIGDTVFSGGDIGSFLSPFLPFCRGGDIYSVSEVGDGSRILTICDENCDIDFIFSDGSNIPVSFSGSYFGRKTELFIDPLEK